MERFFRFQYSTTIREEYAAGGPIDVWVPLPKNTEQQIIGEVEVTSPLPHVENIEPLSGNRMLHVRVAQGSPDVEIIARYNVRRKRIQVEKPAFAGNYGSSFDRSAFAQYLAPNAKVPLDASVGAAARAVTEPHDPPLVLARKLFDHLMGGELEYDSAGCTPGRASELGDLARACDLRKGTCTEFHGIYAARARSLGIPVRFNFGFNVPEQREEATIAGYHCWLDIFLPDAGWFPIDVTEAMKVKGKDDPIEHADFYFGGADCHRVQLTQGRDLWLEPRQSGGPVDKLIFSHAESNERTIDPHFKFSVARVTDGR